MRVVETVAGLCRGHGRVLACQHQVVQRALRPGEFSIGREGARDVAGVAVELAAGVDQHQVAIAHGRGIGAVVQHAGVGAGRDDGAVGRVLRTTHAEFVQQLGVEMELAHVLAFAQHAGTDLHRADVGAGADLRGTSHHVLFVRILDQPHFIERPAQVALLLGAQRTEAHARPNAAQPTVDACFQSLVGSERIPDGVAVFEQLGKGGVESTNRKGLIDAECLGRCIGPEPEAIPNFAFEVFRCAEQRGTAVARQHQPGVGLGETGQVMKVAVEPEQEIAVTIARALGCGRDDGDAVLAQLRGETCAARSVERGGERGVCGHGVALIAWSSVVFNRASRPGVPTSVHGPV